MIDHKLHSRLSMNMKNTAFYSISVIAALLLALSVSACKEEYKRKSERLLLGDVTDLIQSKQHVSESATLVFLDDIGWSAMSTHCTHDGCDLTFDDQTLLCSCCDSVFDHQGHVLRGPAKRPLPWYEIVYLEGKLFAYSGRHVDSSYRFSAPDIKQDIDRLRLIREKNKDTISQVPDILHGRGDGELGKMFVESEEDEIFERELEQQGFK